jgi:hypothetical protein
MNGGAAATGGGPLKAIRAHFAPPPSGARYILFEAVRYVYNAERCRFERAAVCAGKTCVRAAPRAPTALVGSFGSPHAAEARAPASRDAERAVACLASSSRVLVVSVVTASRSYDEIGLAADAGGLAADEAARRLALIGPNRIPFEVDALGASLQKEFMSIFYLYQFVMYIVWFWFSYLAVGAILFMVVLASAALNIAIARANQRSIARMTSYVTLVRVVRRAAAAPSAAARGAGGSSSARSSARLRSESTEDAARTGAGELVPSTELVPGDVIRVRGDRWTLPCDAVVVRGTAVCDESGLTGESMPVRKAACPARGSAAAADACDAHRTLVISTGSYSQLCRRPILMATPSLRGMTRTTVAVKSTHSLRAPSACSRTAAAAARRRRTPRRDRRRRRPTAAVARRCQRRTAQRSRRRRRRGRRRWRTATATAVAACSRS